MSPPHACIHAGEIADPVTSAERIRQLENRMKVQDERWEKLTDPETGSLTRLMRKVDKMDLRMTIYVGLVVGVLIYGPKLLDWIGPARAHAASTVAVQTHP